MILLAAAPALAHGEAGEGDLVLTIGFADEPAYAGLPNAAQLHVEHDGEPVNDLKPGDIQVEVTFGDETSEPMDMEPWFFFEGGELVFGEPGEYRADFVPSQPGKYTFHFTGTIDGEEVDEEMTSGPDTFSVVEDVTAAVSFPAVDAPSNEELATRVDEEVRRAPPTPSPQPRPLPHRPRTPRRALAPWGMVGIVLGAIGIIAAIAALAIERRKAA